jgi:hypothetical protein
VCVYDVGRVGNSVLERWILGVGLPERPHVRHADAALELYSNAYISGTNVRYEEYDNSTGVPLM